MELSIENLDKGSWTLIDVGGELDLFTAPNLREMLIQADDRVQPLLVIDLDDVTFMDSTGLGVLIGGLRRARERSAEMVLVCTSRPVLRVLEITGLHHVFTIHASITEASTAG